MDILTLLIQSKAFQVIYTCCAGALAFFGLFIAFHKKIRDAFDYEEKK